MDIELLQCAGEPGGSGEVFRSESEASCFRDMSFICNAVWIVETQSQVSSSTGSMRNLSHLSSVQVKWSFREAINPRNLGSSVKAILILHTMQINTNRHEFARYKTENHVGPVITGTENNLANCHCW